MQRNSITSRVSRILQRGGYGAPACMSRHARHDDDVNNGGKDVNDELRTASGILCSKIQNAARRHQLLPIAYGRISGVAVNYSLLSMFQSSRSTPLHNDNVYERIKDHGLETRMIRHFLEGLVRGWMCSGRTPKT